MSNRPCADCPVIARQREAEERREWYARAREIHAERMDAARLDAADRERRGWRAWLRAHGLRGPVERYAKRAARRYNRSMTTRPLLMGNGRKTYITRPLEGWERNPCIQGEL